MAKGHRGRPMRGDKQKSPVIGMVGRTTKRRLGRVKAVVTADVTSDMLVGQKPLQGVQVRFKEPLIGASVVTCDTKLGTLDQIDAEISPAILA